MHVQIDQNPLVHYTAKLYLVYYFNCHAMNGKKRQILITALKTIFSLETPCGYLFMTISLKTHNAQLTPNKLRHTIFVVHTSYATYVHSLASARFHNAFHTLQFHAKVGII